MSVAQLEQAAAALGDLLDGVVFLGGATVGLWRTDLAARAPRVTLDVDVVAEVHTLGEYDRFQAALRARGFREDVHGGVICRWQGPDGLVLDAVPVNTSLAGMSDRWLPDAIAVAVSIELRSGVVIRVVSPPWLTVLKLQAFEDRGNNDPMASRDFEDLVLLVDGREELHAEIDTLPDGARAFLAHGLSRVMALRSFDYAVEGALAASDARERARHITTPRFAALAARRPARPA